MDKVLIILIVLLGLAIIALFFITRPKRKKKIKEEKCEEIDIVKEPEVIENITSEPETVEIVKEEPVIDLNAQLDDDLERTREQTEVIEIISSMQEKAKDLTERVADYEDEQEENAIISYTELLNAVKNKKDVQEELSFESPKEEVKKFEEPVVREEKPYDGSKKFRSSEAISPLGRINKQVSSDSYKSNVKPANMHDEEFLKSLKDFRDNL